MKSCNQCKHYDMGDYSPFCFNSKYGTLDQRPNWAAGVMERLLPVTLDEARGDETKCGKEARGFEMKVSVLKRMFA